MLTPKCHPKRKHGGKGLCRQCYNKLRWKNPAYRAREEEGQRRRWLKNLYNLTPEQYETKLKEQNGGCEICSRKPVTRRLAIDHDHKTKQIRGLLCWRCNKVIGWMYDSAELLTKAAEYVTKYRRIINGKSGTFSYREDRDGTGKVGRRGRSNIVRAALDTTVKIESSAS